MHITQIRPTRTNSDHRRGSYKTTAVAAAGGRYEFAAKRGQQKEAKQPEVKQAEAKQQRFSTQVLLLTKSLPVALHRDPIRRHQFRHTGGDQRE